MSNLLPTRKVISSLICHATLHKEKYLLYLQENLFTTYALESWLRDYSLKRLLEKNRSRNARTTRKRTNNELPHCLLAMASDCVWEASTCSPLRVGGEWTPPFGLQARLASHLLAVASCDSPELSKMIFFTQKPQFQSFQGISWH